MRPFTWDDYLELAVRLTQDVEDEVALRTAISRAFYAAYHSAAHFVRWRGILTTGQSHRAVWGALAKGVSIEHVRIGQSGDKLKRLRVRADYSIPFLGDLPLAAGDAITQARSLVEAIRHLP